MQSQPQPSEEQHVTEYLANERTFLAWIRTSIAVITLGFVVAKFSLWLHEIARSMHTKVAAESGISLPIGLAMMACGGLLAVFSLGRYHAVNRAIKQRQFHTNRALSLFTTVSVVILAVIMMAYLLETARQI